MSDIVIRAEGLGKQYCIGGRQARYRTLRDSISNAIRATFLSTHNLLQINTARSNETIWALKDISFEVKQGEVVGIIGPNGAGKSTLLKILSRITEPTEGYADIFGRVGSLLEVGTGFHPELTGRENIFLNGAILGMKRQEIQRQFDEIVAFAEVEKFIDTPVKHYSSGMYLRLAFAVAAHLEPEILLVDEVLAVGDMAFQKKCLGKMEAVARGGRTVLFVSHHMAAVSSLCSRGILLSQGCIVAIGDTGTVVQRYQSEMDEVLNLTPLADRQDRNGSGRLRFTTVRFAAPAGRCPTSGEELSIVLECCSTDGVLNNVDVEIQFLDMNNTMLFTCAKRFTGPCFDNLSAVSEIVCTIPALPLAAGVYRIHLWSAVGKERADYIENAAQLVVMEGDFFGSGRLPVSRKHGSFLVHHSWSSRSMA